jgi:hypothetical protein
MEGDRLGDLDIDGRSGLLLKLELKGYNVMIWI